MIVLGVRHAYHTFRGNIEDSLLLIHHRPRKTVALSLRNAIDSLQRLRRRAQRSEEKIHTLLGLDNYTTQPKNHPKRLLRFLSSCQQRFKIGRIGRRLG